MELSLEISMSVKQIYGQVKFEYQVKVLDVLQFRETMS